MTNDLFSNAISKDFFTEHIKAFDFEELFIELGWDRFNKTMLLNAGGQKYKLQGIVEKRGFAIFRCRPEDDSRFPNAAERDRLDRQITRQHNEHLVIYSDKAKTRQLWEYRLKEPNQPDRRRREEYYTHQDPDTLFHKLEGLFFSLDEEEQISIIDVKKRVASSSIRIMRKSPTNFTQSLRKSTKPFANLLRALTNTAMTTRTGMRH